MATTNPLNKDSTEHRILTQEQIKEILNDTSGIIHFNEEPNNINDSLVDSSEILNNDVGSKTLIHKTSTKNKGTGEQDNSGTTPYTVMKRAFFTMNRMRKAGEKPISILLIMMLFIRFMIKTDLRTSFIQTNPAKPPGDGSVKKT